MTPATTPSPVGEGPGDADRLLPGERADRVAAYRETPGRQSTSKIVAVRCGGGRSCRRWR